MEKCICCKREFEPYVIETDCAYCSDGDEEVETEFGEGSFYRRCRNCKGTGVSEYTQYQFCSEDCYELYTDNED